MGIVVVKGKNRKSKQNQTNENLKKKNVQHKNTIKKMLILTSALGQRKYNVCEFVVTNQLKWEYGMLFP